MGKGKLLFLIGSVILAAAIGAATYTLKLEQTRQKPIQAEVLEEVQPVPPKKQAQPSSTSLSLPKKNPMLPEKNSIRIPRLEVNTEIFTGEDSESALRKGAWIVPDFKTPSGNALLERNEPIIIASHVYGYSDWTEEFRNRVSFAGLEKLEQGDLVEIIWQQRKYTYEITSGEKSEEISNYDTDLILYTCEDLTGSDVRVIKYAKLRQDLL